MSQPSLFEDRPRRGTPVREVRLVLPYPPSTNSLKAIFTPKGKAGGPPRMIDSDAGRAYKAAVKLLLERAGALFRWHGLISLELDVFRPRRTGDLGNREKVLSDGLQTELEKLRKGGTKEHPGLFEDDEQVVETRMRRYEDKEYPRVQATVRVVAAPSGPPPDRWPQPPGWEEAIALVEQALEKKRERERKKRKREESAQDLTPATPAYQQPLPSGSSPGTPSYGSKHWPQGIPKRKSRAELAAMAKPASYRPLPAQAQQATLDTASSSANRGKNDD